MFRKTLIVASMCLFANFVVAEETATPAPTAAPAPTAEEIKEAQARLDKATIETKITQEIVKKEDLEKKALDQKKANAKAQSDLDNFGFGLGIGSVILASPTTDITSAVIDHNTVVVTGEEKYKMGFWLTASWINDDFPSDFIGWGPFVGVQLGGDNQLVNSFAAGIDFSFKRLQPKLPLDFQLGYGITRIKSLADGYTAGNAPPEGASQPLFKDSTAKGFVFIVSYKL